MASRLAQLGRSLRSPIYNAGKWYNKTAEQKPLTTGILTTGIKTSAADLFAQLVVEKRDEVDWRRHSVFCVFGFAYLGGFQYYLYNHLFSRWCATITAYAGHRGSAPVKVFIDQAIHHPFLYFPTFYSLKGLVQGAEWQDTLQKYRDDLWENCKALWTIWVPAQMVNFSVVPRHLRIPFVAGVSFAWTVIISCMRGALKDPAAAAAAATATASEHQQLALAATAVVAPAAATTTTTTTTHLAAPTVATTSHLSVSCPVSVSVAAEHTPESR